MLKVGQKTVKQTLNFMLTPLWATSAALTVSYLMSELRFQKGHQESKFRLEVHFSKCNHWRMRQGIQALTDYKTLNTTPHPAMPPP